MSLRDLCGKSNVDANGVTSRLRTARFDAKPIALCDANAHTAAEIGEGLALDSRSIGKRWGECNMGRRGPFAGAEIESGPNPRRLRCRHPAAAESLIGESTDRTPRLRRRRIPRSATLNGNRWWWQVRRIPKLPLNLSESLRPGLPWDSRGTLFAPLSRPLEPRCRRLVTDQKSRPSRRPQSSPGRRDSRRLTWNAKSIKRNRSSAGEGA